MKRDYGTGSIYIRGDGRVVASIMVNGKRKYLYGKTEREVKRKLKEYNEELIKNNYVEARKSTVGTYMLDWLSNDKFGRIKPKSYDRLEQTVIYQVIPSIGDIQLGTLTSDDISKMLNDLKAQGLSYSSVVKAHQAVNNCFENAVKKRAMIWNPAHGVDIPAKEQFENQPQEVVWYTEDEVRAIYKAARSEYKNGKQIYRLGDIVILAVNTGLRLAEMLGLKWCDVDTKNRVIKVRDTRVAVKNRGEDGNHYKTIEQKSTKTRSGNRDVPLNDDALGALIRLYAITGRNKYVLSTKEGTPCNQRPLDRMLRQILKAAELPDEKIYGFHALRHTFATLLLNSGEEISVVSKLLGHSSVDVTYNTYIHVCKEQKASSVAKLGAIISAKS